MSLMSVGVSFIDRAGEYGLFYFFAICTMSAFKLGNFASSWIHNRIFLTSKTCCYKRPLLMRISSGSMASQRVDIFSGSNFA